MKVTPSCGALSSTTGYSVHLNATNLSPGTNTLYIGEQGPNHDTTTTVGTLTVPDDGTLDQTVTLPAQSTAAPVRGVRHERSASAARTASSASRARR